MASHEKRSSKSKEKLGLVLGPEAPKVVHRIFWIGDVDDAHLERVIDQISPIIFEDPMAIIDLWIRSDGGPFNVAQAFLDFVRVNNVQLATTAFGYVSSAGTLIFGAGIVKQACRMSRFFFHKLYVPVEPCNMDIDESSDLRDSIRVQHRFSNDLLRRLYNLSQEQVDCLIKRKTRWSAQQMKKMGIVDQII